MPRHQECPRASPSPQKELSKGTQASSHQLHHAWTHTHTARNRFPLISSGCCSPSSSQCFLQWRVTVSIKATLPVWELCVSDGLASGQSGVQEQHTPFPRLSAAMLRCPMLTLLPHQVSGCHGHQQAQLRLPRTQGACRTPGKLPLCSVALP